MNRELSSARTRQSLIRVCFSQCSALFGPKTSVMGDRVAKVNHGQKTRYSKYLTFFMKILLLSEMSVSIPTTPNTRIPNPILCTISSKALLLMNLQTLQSTNLSSTPFTPNPPPISTNLTELPDRLHPILVHPWSSCLIISHWRRGQELLNLLL